MSLGPQPTSVMAPYGLPSAFSTEKQIRSKTSRHAAPTALEVNSEGVIQLDGISTRGLFMSGGPQSYTRQTTMVPTGTNAVTLTPQGLVDGVVIVADGNPGTTITLPTVTSVNAFLNSNLVTGAASLDVNAATTSPISCFKVTVITNQAINFAVPATVQPGHAASGYSVLWVPVQPADLQVNSLALGATRNNVILISTNSPRVVVDVWFFQITGTSADPEWLIVSNT